MPPPLVRSPELDLPPSSRSCPPLHGLPSAKSREVSSFHVRHLIIGTDFPSPLCPSRLPPSLSRCRATRHRPTPVTPSCRALDPYSTAERRRDALLDVNSPATGWIRPRAGSELYLASVAILQQRHSSVANHQLGHPDLEVFLLG
ncbi:hypothetical protein ZIOFF_001949 [Zingiber officinale]|uniref:Uncharacterized protein n=1 Tax=Zingiber officinale TaxID=94328 RepID=A0A8J5IP68_ZINOF|nr:hypothetical protein ZIOFF_001949 [Zingiber officinale]